MYIVTAEEMYEIDQYAIKKGGIDGKVLMENAGSQVASRVMQDVAPSQSVAILAGSGNNGGDGFVIARYLKEKGYHAVVFQLVEDKKIKGDAAYHKQLYRNADGQVVPVVSGAALKEKLTDFSVVIDAILGIGVTGKIREPLRSMIEAVNQTDITCLSVDIPSGVPANDREKVDIAIQADKTYIIAAPKQSLYAEPTSPYYGDWEAAEIGIPCSAYQSVGRKAWGKGSVAASFPKREKFAHKGSNGKGLIIGGQTMMPGSVLLSARASLRAGAGLITVATVRENIPIIASGCAESTYHLLPNLTDHLPEDTLNEFNKFDAIAIGMGMGRDNSNLLADIIQYLDKPVLVDADGLYHVKKLLNDSQKRKSTIILTPHYGEMAMLTDRSVSEVKQAPFHISRQFAKKHDLYVVLKGKNTIITAPNGDQIVSDRGNAGLAKGGTGDVLSGILLTMLMQHDHIMEALGNGCYIHGKSAELLVKHKFHTENDMLATDVIEGLALVFRTLS